MKKQATAYDRAVTTSKEIATGVESAPVLDMVANDNGPALPNDPSVAALAAIDDLYGEAKHWADGQPIDSQEVHDEVARLYDSLHEAGAAAETLRVAEKKPLDEQVDAIQAKYNPYVQPKKGKVALGKEALGALLAVWRKKVADEKEARAKAAADEAEKLRAVAVAAMRESSGNLEAREVAEEKLAFSKDADRFAKRAEKAATTGTGLRTVWRSEITDIGAALDWAYERDEAAFLALVNDMAEREVRSGIRTIPGVRIWSDKVV
jgi:hypothetical protein